MSSEIYYDRAYIRVGDRFIPVVNHGSSNCFDFDACGREVPEKHWSVLNYTFHGRQLFTEEEIRQIAAIYEAANSDNRDGIRKSRNRSFDVGEFGRWIMNGMKTAHTMEEYRTCGNTVVVVEYAEPVWKKHVVYTTKQLLDKLCELDGKPISVSFWDNRTVMHYPTTDELHLGTFLLLVKEGVLSLPFNEVDSVDYELFCLEDACLCDAASINLLIADWYRFDSDLRHAMEGMRRYYEKREVIGNENKAVSDRS